MHGKKLWMIGFMTILFSMTAFAVGAEGTKPTAGNCGTHAVWRLDAETGTLTVSGTEALPDYESSADVPWYPVAAEIRSVEIRRGITAIGACHFADCRYITKMTIPGTVTAVAENAFQGCVSLSEIVYGGTREAWEQAFSGHLAAGTALHCEEAEPPEHHITGTAVTTPPEHHITGIAVTTPPEKTVYGWGESFDPTGMRVSAVYDDGTAGDITDKCVFSPSAFLTAGEQALTVCYENFTAAISVTVRKVRYIRVTGKPDKAVYMVGDSLETDGMVVTVTYEDDSTREITEGFRCLQTELDTAGNTWITVTYGGTATAFWVKVKSKEASVAQIRVAQMPEKCVYMEGMPLATDGMRLKVTYEDGSTEEITEGFRCTPQILEEPGNKWITVTYGGTATAFCVKVKPKAESVRKIRVTKNPDNTVYKPGDPLATVGMLVTVTYEDGSTEEIAEGFQCSPMILEESGTKWITVTFGGTATAFPVKVKTKWEMVKTIRVAQNPDKRVYVAGSPLLTDGMIVRVTFEDGTTEDITEGFRCAPLTVDTVNATGYQWITVTFGGTATAFPVKVIPSIASIMQPVFASEQTVKIKFIGDSITQGVGSSDYNPTGEVIIARNPTAWSRNLGEKSWAALLEKRLETDYHADVTNNGIRGVSTHQILYFWNELVDGDEDVVICMLGTNNRTLDNETNFTYTTDSLYSELQTIKNRLEAKGTKVIFMSPCPASESNEEKSGKHFHMNDVAEVVARLASDNEMEYIDLYQKTLDYTESTGISLNSLLADGLHPNDKLYALMYEWICEALGMKNE